MRSGLDANWCDSAATLKPVRAIPRSHRSVRGHFSFRGSAAIQYESTLERDFLARQEHDRAVAEVVSQPCRIPYQLPSGRASHYTPDFLVLFRPNSGPVEHQRFPLLVEVKPEADWRRHWRDWAPKWKAARRYAREQGWQFRVMDESRIRTQALENISFLRRYRDHELPETESVWIIDGLRELGSASVDYLVAKHFPGLYAAEGIFHLWHLLATRRLECDIHRPLTMGTELWVPDED